MDTQQVVQVLFGKSPQSHGQCGVYKLGRSSIYFPATRVFIVLRACLYFHVDLTASTSRVVSVSAYLFMVLIVSTYCRSNHYLYFNYDLLLDYLFHTPT